MPFIGNQPALSYTSFAKQDFTTSATTSYTLDNPVANANELALFINFVRQEPTTAYSASGTSLTLTSATSASDDMYCVFLGKAVQTVNPPNGSVGTAQIADGSITEAKFSSGVSTITEADNWRLTANTNSGTDGFVTANWERSDSNGYTKIGTGLSESSGVFSFATTGIYLITYHASFLTDGGDIQCVLSLNTTTDNSTYIDVCHAVGGNGSGTDGIRTSASSAFIFDVTNTTNCKFKFETESMSSTTALIGNTSHSFTSFTTVRLGDT